MSDELSHIRHGGALSTMLAVPAMPVEENEMGDFAFLKFLFDPEDALDRGASSTHQSGVLFGNPHPSISLLFCLADLLRSPLFDRQRNSLRIHHLQTISSESVRVLII